MSLAVCMHNKDLQLVIVCESGLECSHMEL